MDLHSDSFGFETDSELPAKLISVLEAMADGVWVCDATPKLLWINSACEKLNDIRREDVCGRTVDELLGQGNFDTDVTHRVLKERRSVAIVQKVVSGRTLLVNGVPVFDDAGDIQFVVGSERDLTELNVLREELEEKQQLNSRISSELLALKLRDAKLKEIVATSSAMEQVMETVLKVAQFDTTIILNGASGSGKSMIARVLHEGSSRRDNQFLSLNCGAIPHTLIEAELFGYVEGAFTGALKGGKSGLLEAASGGTLFLDEIDAFPLEVQVKLLTFLDTRGFIRVGDIKVQQVDVRLIVATNQNLEDKVRAGEFREDLWFRLNVVPVHMPSLSDRREDIPVLVRQILKRLSARHGMERAIDPDAIELLSRYSFPGNVRELENILEYSFVLSLGPRITITDLPESIRSIVIPMRRIGEGVKNLKQELAQVERQYLDRALMKSSRQVDIAKSLGVSQPTIARMLKKHGLTEKQ